MATIPIKPKSCCGSLLPSHLPWCPTKRRADAEGGIAGKPSVPDAYGPTTEDEGPVANGPGLDEQPAVETDKLAAMVLKSISTQLCENAVRTFMEYGRAVTSISAEIDGWGTVTLRVVSVPISALIKDHTGRSYSIQAVRPRNNP